MLFVLVSINTLYLIVNGVCRFKRCCLALFLVAESAVLPIKDGSAPFLSVKAGMTWLFSACQKAAFLSVSSRYRCPMWISGWSVGSTLIWWITSSQGFEPQTFLPRTFHVVQLITHQANRLCYRRLRSLEGYAVGLKKPLRHHPQGHNNTSSHAHDEVDTMLHLRGAAIMYLLLLNLSSVVGFGVV